jgi:hypothetical protein
VNTTKTDTVFGPVKLRVTRLHSDVGDPTLDDTEGGKQGAGATMDLTHMLRNGRLNPGDTSNAREVVVKLANFKSFRQGKDLRMGLFDLQANVLAKRVVGPPKPVADSTKK